MQTNYLHLVPRLIMCGAILSLPHTFMAWYLINFMNFTLVGGVCKHNCLLERDFGPVLTAEDEEEKENDACVISGFRRGVN
jgi:hypothetical protein